MKKMMLMMGLLLMSSALIAQETGTETAGTMIDVTTFGGMMALVTMAVTQFSKLIPFINEHKWAKVLTSLGVGIAATMACWGLQVSDYLAGLVWWQALIAGAAVGMSSCGFYDLVKSIYQLFSKKDEQ